MCWSFPSTSEEAPALIDESSVVCINPMADGRCFWTCLYLKTAPETEKGEWLAESRTLQGFPGNDRQKFEKELVAQFAKGFFSHACEVCEPGPLGQIPCLSDRCVMRSGTHTH